MPHVAFDGTLAGWRAAARALLAAGVAPDDAVWESAADAQAELALGGARAASGAGGPAAGGAEPPAARPGGAPFVRVPRRFLALAGLVACHRDPGRWGALYRALWRLTAGGEPRLLEVTVDPDVLRLTRMAKAVGREVHKMHAFVRFRAAPAAEDAAGGDAAGGGAAGDPLGAEYVAWFEPEHDVVERAAPLFARRFPNMRWAILTPRGTARWDGAALSFGPGVPVREGPRDDSLEALWGVYYAHVFNPARLKLAAMRSEMPARYWRNLPEARLIDGMVREAPARVRRMVEVAGRGGVGGLVDSGSTAGGGAGGAGAARDRAVMPEPERADVVVRTWWGGDVTAGRDGAVGGGAGGGVGSVVRVGGVGWGGGDDTWYPEGVGTHAERLRYYAGRLGLVEVDASLALPTRALAGLWAAATPGGFVFDVRAHALLAGRAVEPRRLPRRVRDLLPPSLAGANRVMADEVPARVRRAVWDDLLAAVAGLAEAGKLGAVHLRLPRGLGPGREGAALLAEAAEALGAWPAAVEFREAGWLAGRVRGRTLGLLGRLGLACTAVVAGGGAGEGAAAPGGAAALAELAAVQPRFAAVRLYEAGEPGAAERAAACARALAGAAAVVHAVAGARHGAGAARDAEAVAALLRAGAARPAGR